VVAVVAEVAVAVQMVAASPGATVTPASKVPMPVAELVGLVTSL
jgi:hypothetical protein